jgi:hypothetical protein
LLRRRLLWLCRLSLRLLPRLLTNGPLHPGSGLWFRFFLSLLLLLLLRLGIGGSTRLTRNSRLALHLLIAAHHFRRHALRDARHALREQQLALTGERLFGIRNEIGHLLAGAQPYAARGEKRRGDEKTQWTGAAHWHHPLASLVNASNASIR